MICDSHQLQCRGRTSKGELEEEASESSTDSDDSSDEQDESPDDNARTQHGLMVAAYRDVDMISQWTTDS